MARGAVGTAVINQDLEHPLKTLERQRLQDEQQQQATAAAAQKQRAQNASKFKELYEVGGDWWSEFTVPVLAELGKFRDQIYQYQLGGGTADNPDFQVWYAENKQKISAMMDKTNYMKDEIDTYMGSVQDDPLRDDTYYSTLFSDLLRNPDGSPRNPAEIDLDVLKQAQYDMGGYNGLQSAETFSKNMQQEVITRMRTQSGLSGDITGINMEQYSSNLFELDEQGQFIPDANGNPKMKISPETLAQWKADPDRSRYMDELVTIIDTAEDSEDAMIALQERFGDRLPYGVARQMVDNTWAPDGTKKYDIQYEEDYSQMQQQIMDPLLRPYATRELKPGGARFFKEDDDKGLTREQKEDARVAMKNEILTMSEDPYTDAGELKPQMQHLQGIITSGKMGGKAITDVKFIPAGADLSDTYYDPEQLKGITEQQTEKQPWYRKDKQKTVTTKPIMIIETAEGEQVIDTSTQKGKGQLSSIMETIPDPDRQLDQYINLKEGGKGAERAEGREAIKGISWQ